MSFSSDLGISLGWVFPSESGLHNILSVQHHGIHQTHEPSVEAGPEASYCVKCLIFARRSPL